MNRIARIGRIGRLGRTASANLRYWQRVKNLFGSGLVAYWPLVETSGTAAVDVVGARNGTYANATLDNLLDPFGPTKAPQMSGTGSYINVINSVPVFSGAEGSVMEWVKLSPGLWTDGTSRRFLRFVADGNNGLYCIKDASNVLKLLYTAGASTKQAIITQTVAPTNWFLLTVVWSKSADRLQVYVNDLQGNAGSGLGVWAGNPIVATLTAGDATGSQAVAGWFSGAKLFNREVTQAEIRQYMDLSPRVKRLAVLGDSNSDGAFEWPRSVSYGYNEGLVRLIGHAVGGQGVMPVNVSDLRVQTAAAASDNANIIIIALGTNDNDAGDMTALQAEAEAGIADLQASNPGAALYWLNVLPRWTDNTGAVEVDKSHIRTAIAAACLARGITCLDGYNGPAIAAGDTTDGLHLTDAGHAKLAAWVLAQL